MFDLHRGLSYVSYVENKMNTRRVQPERNKINLDQPNELRYWTRALKVSKEEIRIAIEKVGNSAAAVRKELGIMGKEH
jgi:hypothetical protein